MHNLLRYKIIQTIVLLVLVPTFSFSQERELNLLDHDDKAFHFGIYLGVNRSHYNFSHHPQFLQQMPDSILSIESINSTGINLGWLVNMRISEHFDLRAYPLNLVFTEKAFQYHLPTPNILDGESSYMIKKVQGITLSFPAQIKFTSDRIYNLKVYMMGGAKFEYDFAANAGDKKAENLIKLSKLDYGIEAGMGFHLYFPVFVLSPEIKLGWGLRNVHSRDKNLKFSNVIDQINSRTITFSLTIE
jgi:hypothetical protein